MVQIVGDKFIGERKESFSYRHVISEENGWVDTSKYLPANFDLVSLKIEGKITVIKGWRSNNTWDGMKYESGDKVIAWKRTEP